MAEERPAPAADQPAPAPAAPQKPKKKKKRSKLGLLLWLAMLGLGTAVGMHLSGYWDGRPLFWSVAPKVPYIGETLVELFQIPPEYSMTVAERRAIELADWQRRLDERERGLSSRDVALDALSGDLQARQAYVNRRETALIGLEDEAMGGPAPTEDEQELINQVAQMYREMSARNAAQVIEMMRDRLAVDVLMKLPNDARSAILGKLKPQKAARLTELMARPR